MLEKQKIIFWADLRPGDLYVHDGPFIGKLRLVALVLTKPVIIDNHYRWIILYGCEIRTINNSNHGSPHFVHVRCSTLLTKNIPFSEGHHLTRDDFDRLNNITTNVSFFNDETSTSCT